MHRKVALTACFWQACRMTPKSPQPLGTRSPNSHPDRAGIAAFGKDQRSKRMRSTVLAKINAAPIAIYLTCLVALPAHAEVYKWVDANGKVQYSDSPPADSKKAAVVKSAPSNAKPNA